MNQPIDNLEGITGIKLSDMLGKEECKKCDETGHIVDVNTLGHYEAHSCPCGKYNRIMKEKFKDVSLGELIAYKEMREKEKGRDFEQRAWDEHKDECNGCSLCEL